MSVAKVQWKCSRRNCHCCHHLFLALPALVLHRQVGCRWLPTVLYCTDLFILHLHSCVCLFWRYVLIYFYKHTVFRHTVCCCGCWLRFTCHHLDKTFMGWLCQDVSSYAAQGILKKRVDTEPLWVWFCLTLLSDCLTILSTCRVVINTANVKTMIQLKGCLIDIFRSAVDKGQCCLKASFQNRFYTSYIK